MNKKYHRVTFTLVLFTLVRSLFVLMCPPCRHRSPHNFASNDFQSIHTLIFLLLQRAKAFIYSEERCLMNDSALRGRSISSSLIEQNKSKSERLRMLNPREYLLAGCPWRCFCCYLLLLLPPPSPSPQPFANANKFM